MKVKHVKLILQQQDKAEAAMKLLAKEVKELCEYSNNLTVKEAKIISKENIEKACVLAEALK